MRSFSLCVLLCFILLLSFKSDKGKDSFIHENFSYASKQLKNMLIAVGDTGNLFPRTADNEGKLKSTDMYDWTGGFFPGSLWYTYEYTHDNDLKKEAVKWTEKLEPVQYFSGHHDVGFLMYCSYGNAYRLTGNKAYKDILIQTAKSLSTRYSPQTGCIKSWNVFKSWDGKSSYNFPVIIDNMMNLELLFFASKETGDTSFRHIAISHAEHTMKYQVRDDYSCYHVVCYDSATGKVVARETAQGYANNSAWSRGQAWGIYGFTVCYRETKDKRYLETAQKMADFFLDNKNLPADKIPYWDFNANEKGYTPGIKSHTKEITTIPRDASAAAVTASALFELSKYSGEKGKKYKEAAITMLRSLSSENYRAKLGENADFILMHSTGSIPHGFEIDKPLVYADYYYLEALLRYKKW
ncbi:glycoside hydrolase family 88 protein [Chitinophagaceae bacterium LWZ2-11]